MQRCRGSFSSGDGLPGTGVVVRGVVAMLMQWGGNKVAKEEPCGEGL